MKIDFRKIEVTDIEGNKSTFDISKELGNTIYQKTADLGELELAQRIYKNCAREMSSDEAEPINEYLRTNFGAGVQIAVNEALAKE